MSAQFGRWNFDGTQTPVTELERVRERLSPYGPEGNAQYGECGVDLLWFSFETAAPNAPSQPLALGSGELLIWDGRLDNGIDLVRNIGDPLSGDSSDIEIVGAAWSRWRESALSKFIGDWALSLWNPGARSLVLAADILASRHLYYAVDNAGIRWSTLPDPQVLLYAKAVSLDEEYLAGWLSAFPAPHLSPFRKIRRVPPASLVLLKRESAVTRRHWDFDGSRRIRYATNAEYEEHFRHALQVSVRRRLRSPYPVLAELSGGMDSSSIVCVADIITSASGQQPVDTVSWYSDSEPNWNERPWFTRVEAQRNRTGLHIDVSAPLVSYENSGDAPLRPGATQHRGAQLQFMMRNGHRVLLSGIGGDEFLGGVPTPLPELEDLLVRGNLAALSRQLFAWALAQRRPWIHLLRDTVHGFLPATLSSRHKLRAFASWLDPGFIRRQSHALAGYPKRWVLWGPLPSFQENLDALEGICGQLACRDVAAGYPYERRYPFLDRDLLEFLLAIPREQLVRPGERRSLMRRAMSGIVPEEVLHRRRKAYVSRSLVTAAEAHYAALSAKCGELKLAEIGVVNPRSFFETLNSARQGMEVPALALLRAVAVEEWLEQFARSGQSYRIANHGLDPLDLRPGRKRKPVQALG